MKLQHLIPQRLPGKVIQQFGDARLIRHRDGQHELIGGTAADRTAAFEWVSLFAHEIVFTHFYRSAVSLCRRLPDLRQPAAVKTRIKSFWAAPLAVAKRACSQVRTSPRNRN
jgi:hypothetical protein